MLPSYKYLLRITFHLKHLSLCVEKNDLTVSVTMKYIFLFLGLVLTTYEYVICQGKELIQLRVIVMRN